MLTNEKIKEIIIQSDEHIDEIINNIDDVINYIVHKEVYNDPEISITEISRVLSMRSVESHLAHWKMLKAQFSLVEAHIEPERHEAINLLSKKELKLLIATLKSILDYEKCAFHYNENISGCDESSLDEELTSSLGCKEMEV
jgi:hypothetical protein